MTNLFLKFISSIPVIVLATYFSTFLGVCLIILRIILNKVRSKYSMPISLIVMGIVLLIPKVVESISNSFNLDASIIPFYNDVISNEIYAGNIIGFSKTLIIMGVIFLILIILLNKLITSIRNSLFNFFTAQANVDREIKEKNDLLMQEKREIAKNSRVVECPHCGAENMLTSTTGVCKYCRNAISDGKSDSE